jgi:hypothetical protein
MMEDDDDMMEIDEQRVGRKRKRSMSDDSDDYDEQNQVMGRNKS